ncbi:MAG: ATP-dependent Clp protease adapter ClpS [Desulfobacterales bacterium]|jgi:ATP-dependent Clp protease adaptor protein ClpS|nr:ATP-dependent Clp protease adapter ClpS [Desulfobacterales bacterium]
MNEHKTHTLEDIETLTRERVEEPRLYKVLLHNDDYTTMEFVVDILMNVFHKSQEDAVLIMLNVHKQGIGLCGIYTFDVAETKVDLVHSLARSNGFPLKCTMEDS